MGRFLQTAAAAYLILGPSLAQAGGYGGGEVVVPVMGYPGPVNPMARGALYNTPPSVIYTYAWGYRRAHRARRHVLRVRF